MKFLAIKVSLVALTVTEFLAGKYGLALLTAILSFAVAWYWNWRKETREDVQHDRRAADARIADLTSQVGSLTSLVSELTMKVKPFWSAMESKIIADLTHPSPQFKEMDELLSKLLDTSPETPTHQHITPAERARLVVLLDERIASVDPEITLEEKETAKLMRIVMAKKATEDADVSKNTDPPSPDPPPDK